MVKAGLFGPRLTALVAHILGGKEGREAVNLPLALPSVPIMGETTASWFITVEGKEVERWRKQGCWEWKRRRRAERKEA